MESGVPLERLVDKEPRQFGYIYRAIAYFILSLVTIVYVSTTQDESAQIYIPVLLVIIIFFNARLDRWLKYKFDETTARNTFFVIDAVVLAIVLAGVHLSLLLTFIGLFALFFTAINLKISFMVTSLSSIVGVTAFYLSTIFVFGFQPYFQPTSQELTIVSLICLIIFINLGSYYQNIRIEKLYQIRQHYYNQMTRYMTFANQLSRYAPLQLWQSIMRGETEAKIEYKRKKLTIFFSDIQGFTELSESLIPDDLAFLLNDYLSHMTEIAKQYEATVDKFMGDAILIFFGDPSSEGVEKDAKSCVEMALAMRQQMKILRERWKTMGYPDLHIRMGISTGYCHVGNYGATHRMAYTIVGRDANLAARLQYAAEINEILISQDTYLLVKNEFLCVPKPPIALKGIQGEIKTWQVMEKYSDQKIDNQHWFDYEYKGFHLVLNMDEVQNYEYSDMIDILEKMTQRIKMQQEMTNAEGIAKLRIEDEIKN